MRRGRAQTNWMQIQIWQNAVTNWGAAVLFAARISTPLSTGFNRIKQNCGNSPLLKLYGNLVGVLLWVRGSTKVGFVLLALKQLFPQQNQLDVKTIPRPTTLNPKPKINEIPLGLVTTTNPCFCWVLALDVYNLILIVPLPLWEHSFTILLHHHRHILPRSSRPDHRRRFSLASVSIEIYEPTRH